MKRTWLIFLFVFILVILSTTTIVLLYDSDIWVVSTFLVLLITLGAMFFQFEKGKISSKEISLIAILSGVSVISRLPFAAIPSVQPCTFIIICTGYVFGPVAGFMVGATTALLSNMFLGQGPWTLFQMLAWGLAGATASIVSKLKIKITGLIIFGAIWGYLFGWIMNLWFWLAYIYPHNLQTLTFYMGTSLGFDTLHALGNVIFLILLGERTIKIFQRYKNRFHIEYTSEKKKECNSVNDSVAGVID